MLLDRKYTDIISGSYTKTTEEFNEKYVKMGTIDKDAMNFVRMNTTKRSLPCFIFVYFSTEMSIGIKPLAKVTERMMVSKMNHCLLVYPGSITSSAKKYVEKSAKIKIEIFSEEELLVNITKHRLMPIHYVLTDKEKNVILTDSKIIESQLPRILVSDPIARYYGMRRGDIVRIIRKSDTAGKYMMYRICN
jgi:DNA-directed RNA polymerase I, II, and III subunit RPABC1